jgi:hypothetical protein
MTIRRVDTELDFNHFLFDMAGMANHSRIAPPANYPAVMVFRVYNQDGYELVEIAYVYPSHFKKDEGKTPDYCSDCGHVWYNCVCKHE